VHELLDTAETDEGYQIARELKSLRSLFAEINKSRTIHTAEHSTHKSLDTAKEVARKQALAAFTAGPWISARAS
jgi:hypothetical protein